MALFKILKGQEKNLPTNKTEGWAYVTTDEGNMYVDVSASKRVRIGAHADKADVATKAEGDTNSIRATYLAKLKQVTSNGTTFTFRGETGDGTNAADLITIPLAGDKAGLISNAAQTIKGDKTFTGTGLFSKSSGFEYSGIESAGSDMARPVWFSYGDVNHFGKPVINASKFTYNPGTDTMVVGNIKLNGLDIAHNYLTNVEKSGTISIKTKTGDGTEKTFTLEFLPLAGGTMTGPIQYKTTNYTSTPLGVYDEGNNYGHTIVLGAGGTTFVGAGESAAALRTALNTANENLYLSADSSIYFFTKCDTIGNRVAMIFDTARNLYPNANNTGSLGTSSNQWSTAYIKNITGKITNAISDDKGQNIANTYIKSVALKSGSNYIIQVIKGDGTTSDVSPKFASSSSCGGAADSANVLNINNAENIGVGRMQFFQKTGDATLMPDTNWWSLVRLQHGGYPSTGYWTEMAYAFHSDTIKFRRNQNGTKSAWKTIAFTDGTIKNAQFAEKDSNGNVIYTTYLKDITSSTATDKFTFKGVKGDGSFGTVITIPGADTGKAGLITTGAQTIAGEKTLNNNLYFANVSTTANTTGKTLRGVYGPVGNNDGWRIAGGATASSAGFLEIATCDDGNEPIYVRQYSGGGGAYGFATVARTLTLLDANGNTRIPGSLFDKNSQELRANLFIASLFQKTSNGTTFTFGGKNTAGTELSALTIPNASETIAGLITNADQSFDGTKRFNKALTLGAWTANIKCATWSRLCYIPYNTAVIGSSYIITVQATRGNVVYNNTYSVNTSHSSKGTITCLSNTKYSDIKARIVVNANGDSYFEIYDVAYGATASTTQSVLCRIIGISTGAITKYTAFTDGTTVPSGFSVADTLDTIGSRGGLQTQFITSTNLKSTYIGVNGQNLAYKLYVNGESCFDGKVTVNAKVHITNTEDVNVGANGAFIIGNTAGENLAIDSNEIMARNNGAVSTLYLNTEGGLVRVGSGGIQSEGHIVPSATNSKNLGSSSLRWAKLYIGTADTYGSATKPIYWNAGVPTACTYELKSTVEGGAANRLPYYNATNKIGPTSHYANTTQIGINENNIAVIGSYSLYVNGTTFIQSDAANSTTDGLIVNNGRINVTNYGHTLKIGNANGSYTHFETSCSQFYFNKQIVVNGHLLPYTNNSNYNGTSSNYWNRTYSQWIVANAAGSSTDGGITLYGNMNTNYGIFFRGTGNMGTHGSVTADWATYFTMSNDAGRGWVFRNTGAGNVASISAQGHMTVNGSVGINGTNVGYRFYVNGTSYFNGDISKVGNIYPLANNTKNLGSSSLKWANVYATTFYGNLNGSADTLDGYHFSDLEARYVNVTGDTMTGPLEVNSTITCTDGIYSDGGIYETNEIQTPELRVNHMRPNDKTQISAYSNLYATNLPTAILSAVLTTSAGATYYVVNDPSDTQTLVAGKVIIIQPDSTPSSGSIIHINYNNSGYKAAYDSRNYGLTYYRCRSGYRVCLRYDGSVWRALYNPETYWPINISKTSSSEKYYLVGNSSTSSVNTSYLYSSNKIYFVPSTGTITATYFDGYARALKASPTAPKYDQCLTYFSGQITLGTAAGNAYSGSSNNRNLWSFPAGNADENGSVANVQVLRMSWGSTYWQEIFCNPNRQQLWYRAVISGTANAWKKIWIEGNAVTGAVWNDYAECRQAETQEAGYVLYETGFDDLKKTTERLQHFAGVSSDTWGFSQGETEKAKTPIAVAGRVLVYTYQDRNNYKPGDCVCAAPGGTVDIMTREEVIEYPDRIVGTVSCVPTYEEWGGGEGADRDPVKVNGRIWIKVK